MNVQHAIPRHGWPHRRRALALEALRAVATLAAAAGLAAVVWGLCVLVLASGPA